MTVNLPPETGDAELDTWTYEITQDVNINTSASVVTDPETGAPSIDGVVLGYTLRYLDTAWGTSNTGADFSPTIAGLPAGSTMIFQGLRNTASLVESTNPAEFTWRQVVIPSGATLSTLKAWYRLVGGRNIDWLFQVTEPEGYLEDTGQAVIDLENISIFGLATRLDLAFAEGTPAAPTNIQFATGRVTDNDYVQATPLTSSTLRAERTVSWVGTEPEVSTTASDYVFVQSVGVDGFRAANGFLYMASTANPPAAPIGGVFSFTTGEFTTLPTGWTETAPSSTVAGEQIFVSYWVAVETDASGAITITYATPVLSQIVVNDVKSVNYDGTTNPGAADRYIDTGATQGYFLDGSTGQLIATDVIARDFDVSSRNVRLGPDAGNPNNITGTDNVTIGANAGNAITSANNSVFVGDDSGMMNTTGGNNIGIGNLAAASITTSSNNLFFGNNAGMMAMDANGDPSTRLSWTGNGRNIGIGSLALGSTARTNLTPIIAEDNIGIGQFTLVDVTEGNSNIAMGFFTGGGITTGMDNIFLGARAGLDTTTGSNNILIGDTINASSPTASSEIKIGQGTETVANVGAYDLAAINLSTNFLGLTDTPAVYGTAGQSVVVNMAADGLEFSTLPIPTVIGDLSDVADVRGTTGQILAVDTAGTALEYIDQPAGTFVGLTDTPAALGTVGQVPVVNSAGDALVFANATGATSFLGLTDTPGTYGPRGHVPVVNQDGDGLVFVTSLANPFVNRFGYADSVSITPSAFGTSTQNTISISEVGTVLSISNALNSPNIRGNYKWSTTPGVISGDTSRLAYNAPATDLSFTGGTITGVSAAQAYMVATVQIRWYVSRATELGVIHPASELVFASAAPGANNQRGITTNALVATGPGFTTSTFDVSTGTLPTNPTNAFDNFSFGIFESTLVSETPLSLFVDYITFSFSTTATAPAAFTPTTARSSTITNFHTNPQSSSKFMGTYESSEPPYVSITGGSAIQQQDVYNWHQFAL